MRRLFRLLKWALAAVVLMVIGLMLPVGYVEAFCRGEPQPVTYQPVIADPEWQRREANSYLTYPEWHIVFAYDGLASVLETSDEHAFGYLQSIFGFWQSTCALTNVADRHGGADGATRTMVHTIGVSFTLEMLAKAAYEETAGRFFAWLRGPEKSPQDIVSARMAADYAAFLRQTPWYLYDFAGQTTALWAAPLSRPLRGWERRLALGAEWTAKQGYAGLIEGAVAATGEAKLSIRSVVSGVDGAGLAAIDGVTVMPGEAGRTIIETPRYARFTRILAAIVARGGTIVEIAGNDEIMVSATVPHGTAYDGPGTLMLRLPRTGFDGERLLLTVNMAELTELLARARIGDPGIEHIFDY